MLIVPIEGDKITTKDDGEFVVVGYNNYKTKGPAAFVDAGFRRPTMVIYFFDIEKINGVRVEYQQGSKIFSAMGIVKRKIHLPQINDLIVVATGDLLNSNDGKVKVVGHKLHNKQAGLGKGLLIKGEDEVLYRMKEVLDIKRAVGDDRFDRKKFQKIYNDYLGY